jgi:hypothetical protein
MNLYIRYFLHFSVQQDPGNLQYIINIFRAGQSAYIKYTILKIDNGRASAQPHLDAAKIVSAKQYVVSAKRRTAQY